MLATASMSVERRHSFAKSLCSTKARPAAKPFCGARLPRAMCSGWPVTRVWPMLERWPKVNSEQGLNKLLAAGMKFEPLAAEVGVDAAFVAVGVADLIACLGEYDLGDEQNSGEGEAAWSHVFFFAEFFAGLLGARFLAAFGGGEIFVGAGGVSADAARARPSVEDFFARVGDLITASLDGCATQLTPRSALVTAAM